MAISESVQMIWTLLETWPIGKRGRRLKIVWNMFTGITDYNSDTIVIQFYVAFDKVLTVIACFAIAFDIRSLPLIAIFCPEIRIKWVIKSRSYCQWVIRINLEGFLRTKGRSRVPFLTLSDISNGKFLITRGNWKCIYACTSSLFPHPFLTQLFFTWAPFSAHFIDFIHTFFCLL